MHGQFFKHSILFFFVFRSRCKDVKIGMYSMSSNTVNYFLISLFIAFIKIYKFTIINNLISKNKCTQKNDSLFNQ